MKLRSLFAWILFTVFMSGCNSPKEVQVYPVSPTSSPVCAIPATAVPIGTILPSEPIPGSAHTLVDVGTACFHQSSENLLEVTLQVACYSTGCTKVYERTGEVITDPDQHTISIHSRFIVQSLFGTPQPTPVCSEACQPDCAGAGSVVYNLRDLPSGEYRVEYGDKILGILTLPLETDGTCFHTNSPTPISTRIATQSPASTPTPSPTPTTEIESIPWSCAKTSPSGECLPTFRAYQMRDFTFSPDGTAWAAGLNGWIFQKIGDRWVQRYSQTDRAINALVFPASDLGWAVGDGEQILRWNGIDWQVWQPPPQLGPMTAALMSSELTILAFSSPENVWAGGSWSSESGGGPILYRWDGKRWQDFNLLDQFYECWIEGLIANSPKDVWGLCIGGSSDGDGVLHWDGEKINFADRDPAHFLPLALAARFPDQINQLPNRPIYGHDYEIFAADNIWAVDPVALFHWNGSTWKQVELPKNQVPVSIASHPDGSLWVLTNRGVLLYTNPVP